MSVTMILITFVPIIILFVLFFIFVVLPIKKQSRKDREIQERLAVGDEIVTNAGIRGLVTLIEDETVTIETGGNRTKMIVEKWAISKLLTIKG